MTTGALGGYFYGFLNSKIAVAFTVATGVLYGYIYMLLQMESGALLFGSMALFVILSVIMYFTRSQTMFEALLRLAIEQRNNVTKFTAC